MILTCDFCNKECKNALSKAAHSALGKANPNKRESNFQSFNAKRLTGEIDNWNKGASKHTDERIAKQSKTLKDNLENGTVIHNWRDKKHTEETKEKISKSRKKFLEENPDQVPYRLNHSSKQSWPEKFFQQLLEENGITGWIYNFQHGIYSYDFAFPDLKLDIEIDGATQQSEKVKEIDKRRDDFSKARGWKVLRIDAKELYKEDKEHIVNLIKSFL